MTTKEKMEEKQEDDFEFEAGQYSIRPKREDEIEVTQYLMPNRRPKTVYAAVGVDYLKKAEGLVFSAEVLMTGDVVVYGRRNDQKEEDEISRFAENGPGDKSPLNMLKEIIDELTKEDK